MQTYEAAFEASSVRGVEALEHALSRLDLQRHARATAETMLAVETTTVSSFGARVAALLAAPAVGDPAAPWTTPGPDAPPAPIALPDTANRPRAHAATKHVPRPQTAVPARRAMRWPLLLCGLIASSMSVAALLKSPLGETPKVRAQTNAAIGAASEGYDALRVWTRAIADSRPRW